MVRDRFTFAPLMVGAGPWLPCICPKWGIAGMCRRWESLRALTLELGGLPMNTAVGGDYKHLTAVRRLVHR